MHKPSLVLVALLLAGCVSVVATPVKPVAGKSPAVTASTAVASADPLTATIIRPTPVPGCQSLIDPGHWSVPTTTTNVVPRSGRWELYEQGAIEGGQLQHVGLWVEGERVFFAPAGAAVPGDIPANTFKDGHLSFVPSLCGVEGRPCLESQDYTLDVVSETQLRGQMLFSDDVHHNVKFPIEATWIEALDRPTAELPYDSVPDGSWKATIARPAGLNATTFELPFPLKEGPLALADGHTVQLTKLGWAGTPISFALASAGCSRDVFVSLQRTSSPDRLEGRVTDDGGGYTFAIKVERE